MEAIKLPIKALILDDEPDIVEILTMVGEEMPDFKMLKSTSPVTALELIRKEMIRVVITDINMPELSGPRLIQECASLPWNIDFIVIAAIPDLGQAFDCFNLGAVRTILKPIDFDKVQESLQLSLKKIQEWNEIVLKYA